MNLLATGHMLADVVAIMGKFSCHVLTRIFGAVFGRK